MNNDILDLTTEWMKVTFDKYNQLYWNGKLPYTLFEIRNRATSYGQYYPEECPKGKGVKMITLSRGFEMPERSWEEVLLHEMCHEYVDVMNYPDKGHGKYWRAEAARINRLGGWNIKRLKSLQEGESCVKEKHKRTEFRMMVVKDRYGRFHEGVITPSKEEYYKKWSMRDSWFQFVAFFTSHDTKYQRYAQGVTHYRSHPISFEDFLERIDELYKRNGYIFVDKEDGNAWAL